MKAGKTRSNKFIVPILLTLTICAGAVSRQKNAAVIYTEAFADMREFPSDGFAKEADSYIAEKRNEWRKDLYEFLDSSRYTLESITAAQTAEYCDFNDGVTDRSVLTTKPLPYEKVVNLARLILLEARKQERFGSLSKVSKLCRGALKLSYDVLSERSRAAMMLGLKVKIMAHRPVSDYLSNTHVKSAEKEEFREFFEKEESEKVTLLDSIDGEEERSINLLRQIVLNRDLIKLNVRERSSLDRALEFGRAVSSDAEKLISHYYEKIREAAENRSAESIAAVNRDIAMLARKAGNVKKSYVAARELFFESVELSKEKDPAPFVDRAAALFVVIGVPDFQQTIDDYYRAEDLYGDLLASKANGRSDEGR
ncbi:MAG: hypothetical protein ABIJ27_00930 [Candidatus Omnitrophota bacterium]